jgi:tetratricopeptide (TPR) repeat protein
VFETLDGKPEVVTADRIAQSLQDCRVPVFVLNACKSAQEGEEQFSSVASRLVFSGAMGVVAMAYSVYADAAREFMGRFYGELTTGTTISEAVAKARLSVLNQPLRQSPRGKRYLQDWLVPVLYQQEPYQPFVPSQQDINFEELLSQFENPTDTTGSTIDLPQTGAYGFIGRDSDILRLERAFRQNNIVLLEGISGVGKTELTKGFARWLRDTKGRDNIFFTSFEQGATLNSVISQVGQGLCKNPSEIERFNSLKLEQQEQLVLKYLQTNPCLLIWDNFEPVAGFPVGNEPLLSLEEQYRLREFLKAIREGESWVLITSRQDEPWLDCGYNRRSISGLSETDAEEFAAKVLQTVDVNRDKLPAEYLELLNLLGRHPLSLRVVLPQLRNQNPEEVITALRQGLDTFAGGEERDKSLLVSLDFSFNSLSLQTQKHLPFLGLFSQRVNINLLHGFSGNPEDEFGQAYEAVFGENLTKEQWRQILNEATSASILEHLVEGICKLHPTLPWYLRRRLTDLPIKNCQEVVETLEKKLVSFYTGLANYYKLELMFDYKSASSNLLLEEPNLLQNLRLAEQQQNWEYANYILSVLAIIYQRRQQQSELKVLRRRILKQIGETLVEAKAKGKEAFSLWIYLKDLDIDVETDNWESITKIYQEIIDELIAFQDTSTSINRDIASCYYSLGSIARARRKFEVAIKYYYKVLKIREDIGDVCHVANAYHQLGEIAHTQRKFEEAKKYCHEALKIYEGMGDFYTVAQEYYQLGNIAYQQRKLEEATQHYHKALKIYQDAEIWYGTFHTAGVYVQLGVVACDQRKLEEARKYYYKALKIYEDAGSLHRAAKVYHELGVITQQQQKFEVAIQYYQKALKIKEDIGDSQGAATDYQNLGVVAQEQQQFDQAMQYYQKALTIFEDAEDFHRVAPIYQILGVVAQEQQQFDQAMQYYQKALTIFEDEENFHQVACIYLFLAHQPGKFDQAIQYCKKALKIFEAEQDFNAVASVYNKLGNITQEHRQFEATIQYYNKALNLFESVGNVSKAAGIYHQLGKVAFEKQQFEEAIQYHQKALKIFVNSGEIYNTAHVYHALGLVAQEQQQFDEALQYHQKALKIFEYAGDFYKTANVYHNLGMVAHWQQKFEDATKYYHQAVTIWEDKKAFDNATIEYSYLRIAACAQQLFDQYPSVVFKYQLLPHLIVTQDLNNLTILGRFQEIIEGYIIEKKINVRVLVKKICFVASKIIIQRNENWISLDIQNLGRILQELGENKFKVFWQETMGVEILEEWYSAIVQMNQQG